jgi:hypothetical protein
MNVRYNFLTSSLLCASLLTLSGCQMTSILHPSEDVSVNEKAHEPVTDTALNLDELQPVPVEASSTEHESKNAKPVPIDDLWQRIRMKLALDVPDNARVNSQRNWYVSHPEYLERVGKRAEPFLHLIVEEIDRRGMPMEFALSHTVMVVHRGFGNLFRLRRAITVLKLIGGMMAAVMFTRRLKQHSTTSKHCMITLMVIGYMRSLPITRVKVA